MLCINNFKCSLSEDETLLSEKLSAYLKCSIRNIQILKKAIDARSRKEIWFVYNIAFSVDNEALLLKQNIPYVSQYIPIPEFIIPPIKKIQSPVIIGSGPAGMFAALLVGVTPSDFGGNHPLQGVYWQKQIENRAFCAGDKSYAAPAQRLEDMLKRRSSVKAGEVIPSYSRGVVWGSMDYVLPTFVMDTFRLAINEMDKKLHGYNFPDAVMTGVETRSSSPIRIIREEDMQSPVKGLYPAGEGAGYAGGIVSSAVDGIKAALGLLQKYVD